MAALSAVSAALEQDTWVCRWGLTFSEWSGQSEFKIECTTPSGKGHEPLRFVVTAGERQKFLASFRNRFPDACIRDDQYTE